MQDPVEYNIVDTEHPEQNQTVPAIPLAAVEKTAEQVLQEKLQQLRNFSHYLKHQAAGNENRRALKGRVKRRRKQDAQAKASRKRNR